MKLKKLLAFGLALVMCLAMAACGTNPDEKTDAKPVSITVTENWDFSVGFYPVITPMVSSTYCLLYTSIARIGEIKNHELQGGEKAVLSDFNVEIKDVCFSYQKDTQVIRHASFTAVSYTHLRSRPE